MTVADASCFASTLALGLMAGSLVAEGALLVPFWRGQTPAEFLGWYRKHAALLQRFFGSIEVAAAVLSVAALAATWSPAQASRLPLSVAAVLSVGVLAVFPMYFQRANTSFRTGSIPETAVAAELRRWAQWHWARTAMAFAAFAAAVLGAAA